MLCDVKLHDCLWKIKLEAVVASFQMSLLNWPGGTEENNEHPV